MSESHDVIAKTMRMPAELWAALDAEARREGLSVAEVVRHAVVDYLARMEERRER
jgi:predicted DNA-binding protein